jgi:ArsR family transcriptional regulator
MKAAPVQTLEQLFRALGDDTRLRILALLAAGEICVCHIHGALGLPQPTVSRHLASLRRAGLVATRKDGLWVHYRLAVPSQPQLAGVMRATFEALSVAPTVTVDRRRLSGVTTIPLKQLEQAAANCCK